MSKKSLYKLIVIVITIILLGGAFFFIKDDKTEQIDTSNETERLVVDEIPKDSDLNNVKINMIANYVIPYKDTQIKGDNLIDGSYANRTVFAFTITGVKQLNELFQSLNIYENEKEIPCNIVAHQYNKDEVLVVAVMDNTIDNKNLKVTTTIRDSKTNDNLTISKELSDEKPILNQNIAVGDLLSVNENSYWYRLKNDNVNDQVSKNGDKGSYFEYTRTLNFLAFGENNIIDINKLKVNSELPYEYEVNTYVTETKSGEHVEYSGKNITGEKQIIVTFKVYTESMDDSINNRILEYIDKSYIEYNDNKIYITENIVN